MHKLRRFFYQNKMQIFKVLGIIAFILIIIQVLNYGIKTKNKEELNNLKNKEGATTTIEENKTVISNKSPITGQKVPEQKLENASNLISEFINYCNQQEIENAYNLLTDECKQQMYTSLDIFKVAYYDNVFGGQKKTYTIENWVGNIYKVKITEDILSTGKNSSGSTKQDYMTIEQKGNEYKLNINSYIGYTEIKRTTTKEDITIEVVGRNTYMDYEEYTIKLTNKQPYTIQLDNLSNSDTLYLEDSNGQKYPYYNHELAESLLIVQAGQTREITIKFYNPYVSNREIQSIVFSNMIINKEQKNETMFFRAGS